MAKPETKAEAKTAAKAEPSKEVEEAQEPLKYKTWILKVSVHCEGCKKKVKKILQNIDGVYTTNVDLRQQIVTVTGNVEGDTLVKTLIKKTGKHAELWPEKASPKEKKKSKGKTKDIQSNPESSEGNTNDGGCEHGKETLKTELPGQENAGGKSGVGGDGKTSGNGPVTVKEVKLDAKQQQPVTHIAGSNSSAESGEKIGGGSVGKKKKKKEQKVNMNVAEVENDFRVLPHSGSAPQTNPYGSVPTLIDDSPRCEPVFHQYPPIYAASYNTAYPNYGASYYTQPQSHSYTYMHQMSDPPSFDSDTYPPHHPSDSFELFSDENPNGCSIM